MTSREPDRRSFARSLAVLLVAGGVVRALYVALQPQFDPAFARPLLDGAVYIEMARAGGPPAGVFYLPPLYPWLLAALWKVAPERFGLLYLIQQLLVVGTAGLLALVARRTAGHLAGLLTAACVLLYHPPMFFASCPLGESVAMLLLAAAIVLSEGPGDRRGAAAGGVIGLASLVRPNFLPVAGLWALGDAARRRTLRAVLLAAMTLVALAPALLHNARASGRLVPVSANGGVVFWLGNAPGAVGLYTPAPGFSGSLASQQSEAIAEAGARAGRALDPVEADAFWWREGIRTRLADAAGTVRLVFWRVLLTLDNAEHGLDYAPMLDTNPIRRLAPLPFAAILALAVFAVVAFGPAFSGGTALWGGVIVAALAPIAFYVSSRHRLPLAELLCVPAGIGAASLLTRTVTPASWRGRAAISAGLLAACLSAGVPSGDLIAPERSSALATLADVWRHAGDLGKAESVAREATALDPGNALAWHNLGVIADALGKREDAERSYRSALAADPTQPDAAANLAKILVASGRPGEAVPVLERALSAWPRHAACWTNLVVAYAAAGDRVRARDAAVRAQAAGVALDPALVSLVDGEEGR